MPFCAGAIDLAIAWRKRNWRRNSPSVNRQYARRCVIWEMMGFVESVPFSGSFVRDLSLKDMLDTYAVRAWMEAMAGRLATPNLTEDVFARLEALLEQMMRHAQHDDSHEFSKADFAFHQTIVAAAGNSTLIRLYDMLQFAYWT